MNITITSKENDSLEKDRINITIESKKESKEVEKIINYLNSYDSNKFVVQDDYALITIDSNDILYFYSEGSYTYCKGKEKTYKVKEKLYDLENKSKDFIRISKGYVVNANQVKCFDVSETNRLIAIISNGEKVFVSRRRIKYVLEKLDERSAIL